MQHDAVWAQRAQRELRDLLNDWDPIGVFDPEDGEGPLGNDTLIWPHCDGLIWPQVRHSGAVVTV